MFFIDVFLDAESTAVLMASSARPGPGPAPHPGAISCPGQPLPPGDLEPGEMTETLEMLEL